MAPPGSAGDRKAERGSSPSVPGKAKREGQPPEKGSWPLPTAITHAPVHTCVRVITQTPKHGATRCSEAMLLLFCPLWGARTESYQHPGADYGNDNGLKELQGPWLGLMLPEHHLPQCSFCRQDSGLAGSR